MVAPWWTVLLPLGRRGVEGRACAPSTSTQDRPDSPSPRSSAPGTSSSTSRGPGCRSWSTATAARSTRRSTTRRSRSSPELLGVPDTHQVLFLQGGASQQFAMVPMNFLPKGGSADYVLTGTWSEKALDEAKLLGAPRVARRPPSAPTSATPASHARPSSSWIRRPPTSTSPATTPSSGRSGTPGPTGGLGPAGGGHVLGLPLAADRRLALRVHLRRRAEEPRALRRDGGGDPEGLHGDRPEGHPQDLPLHHVRREQLALQHAAHVRDLPDAQRARLDRGAGRSGGDGAAEQREGPSSSTPRWTG